MQGPNSHSSHGSHRAKHLSLTSRAAAAALLFFLSPALFAQQAQQAQQTQQIPPPSQLALCVTCHGPQGNSQIPQIPSLAGQPQVFLENQMVLIREGLRDIAQMKGLFDKMNDAELVVLARYFADQTPAATAVAANPVNVQSVQRGKALSQKLLCGTCHLPDYSGRAQIPRLAGQHEVFLLNSMKQFRDHAGAGRDTIMSATLFGVKDGELADLAHYFAHFK